MGVNAVAQGCCQLVWHSSTEEQGRQFTLNSAAVHWCLADFKSVGRVNLQRCKCHRCKCSGTRLLSAGLAQQHRRTRQAVYPQLVWHSSTEEQGRQFTLNTAAVPWCLVTAHLYADL